MNPFSTIKIKTTPPKAVIAIGSFLLIGGGGLFWHLNSKSFQTKDLTNYTIKASKGTLPGLITASGTLEAIRSVNVSPEKQGLLQALYVNEGDEVNKGQLLAKMKSGDFKYRLAEIKAEHEKSKNAYLRREFLFSEGAISKEEYEEYKNRFLSTKARLKQREIEGDQLNIRAPFKGYITSRYAEPGAFVTPTTRASTIAGSSSASILELSQGLEVSAKVPESDIGRIQINQTANIRVDSFPDEVFIAKISQIAPRASSKENVTSFEVKLSFSKPSPKLRIGMTADVEFQTGSLGINILVPTVAIVTEGGQPGVLVVGKDKQPKFRKVDLGSSGGSKTAILKGLNAEDLVFIDLPPWAKRKRK